jgi:hypothetical protein
MNKADSRQDSVGPCVFRTLSPPTRDASFDSAATGDDSACFQPSFWSDNRNDGKANPLNGKDLAAHLEEVQHLAFQRGLDSGREEACRMAQASVLPHLKSLIQSLNVLIHQIKNAESRTSAQAVSLAGDIVEQVIGASAGMYDFEELQNDLARAVLIGPICKSCRKMIDLPGPRIPVSLFKEIPIFKKGIFRFRTTATSAKHSIRMSPGMLLLYNGQTAIRPNHQLILPLINNPSCVNKVTTSRAT